MHNEGISKQIAATIIEQLGGGRFIAMTGARDFISGEVEGNGNPGVKFRLPRANDGINIVSVTLTPMDLYDLIFYRVRGTDIQVVQKHEGIYCESLRKIFTDATGLYLDFAPYALVARPGGHVEKIILDGRAG